MKCQICNKKEVYYRITWKESPFIKGKLDICLCKKCFKDFKIKRFHNVFTCDPQGDKIEKVV